MSTSSKGEQIFSCFMNHPSSAVCTFFQDANIDQLETVKSAGRVASNAIEACLHV